MIDNNSDLLTTSATSSVVGRPARRVDFHASPQVGLIALLAGIAFLWASIVAPEIFPYYSNNHDEPVYALQAQALLQGELTLPSTPLTSFFMPWLTKDDGARVIFKYTPVQAVVLALGQVFTGSMHVGIGLVASLTIVICYWCLTELTFSQSVAWRASLLILLSPFFLIQSLTLLPYTTSLLLHLLVWALVFCGIRKDDLLLMMLAGIVLGFDFFARPYDAVLIVIPLGLYMLVTQHKRLWSVASQVLCITIGFGPLLCLVLIYNFWLTGSPFSFPFSILDPLDTLGFGLRSMFPGNIPVLYDLPAGLAALSSNLLQLNLWVFGGALLIGCALLRLLVMPLRPAHWLLVGLLAIFPLGYIFFWGSYMSANLWKGNEYLGPFYYFPVLVPLSVLGVEGWLALRERSPRIAIGLMVFAACANIGLLAWHVAQNLEFTAKSANIYQPITAHPLSNAIVLVPPLYGSVLLHPFAALGNPPALNGPILYALNHYDDNFKLLDAYPGRAVYRFDYLGLYTEAPDNVAPTRLVPMQFIQTSQFVQKLHIINNTGFPYITAYLWNGIPQEEYLLDNASHRGQSYDIDWAITPYGATLTGNYKRRLAAGNSLSPNYYFALAVAFSNSHTANAQSIYERRYWFRTLANGQLEIALPAEEWYNNQFPQNSFVQQDIANIVTDR